MSGYGYDFSVTILSPEGKVYQVEYALKSLENASTMLAAKCKDGVIMGTEKIIITNLAVPGNDQRIYTIDETTGITINGLIPDGRSVVDKARSESNGYLDFTGVPISSKVKY